MKKNIGIAPTVRLAPLLGEDNQCTVCDVRPETCKEYPYTDKKDFVFSVISRANHALVCPAAFAIVEGMKKRFREDDL